MTGQEYANLIASKHKDWQGWNHETIVRLLKAYSVPESCIGINLLLTTDSFGQKGFLDTINNISYTEYGSINQNAIQK